MKKLRAECSSCCINYLGNILQCAPHTGSVLSSVELVRVSCGIFLLTPMPWICQGSLSNQANCFPANAAVAGAETADLTLIVPPPSGVRDRYRCWSSSGRRN